MTIYLVFFILLLVVIPTILAIKGFRDDCEAMALPMVVSIMFSFLPLYMYYESRPPEKKYQAKLEAVEKVQKDLHGRTGLRSAAKERL